MATNVQFGSTNIPGTDVRVYTDVTIHEATITSKEYVDGCVQFVVARDIVDNTTVDDVCDIIERIVSSVIEQYSPSSDYIKGYVDAIQGLPPAHLAHKKQPI